VPQFSAARRRLHGVEANGPSYRLQEAKQRLKKTAAPAKRASPPLRHTTGAEGTADHG
jgi:hypothetical protein